MGKDAFCQGQLQGVQKGNLVCDCRRWEAQPGWEGSPPGNSGAQPWPTHTAVEPGFWNVPEQNAFTEGGNLSPAVAERGIRRWEQDLLLLTLWG